MKVLPPLYVIGDKAGNAILSFSQGRNDSLNRNLIKFAIPDLLRCGQTQLWVLVLPREQFEHLMRMLLALILLTTLSLAETAKAQDLEPRAFSPAPIGMNFALLGYGYSEGNVSFDHALPLEGSTGEIQNLTLGYVRTLDIFGVTGKLAALVPIATGDWEGLVLGEPVTTSRTGLADPLVSLAVDFIGAPARTLQEMGDYQEGTVVGASLLVSVPLGQYDPDKLINLGSNRWAFRGRLGFSQRLRRWNLELIGELWGFTQNSDAFGGTTVDQDPIYSIQANAIYRFRRGFWMALGYGYGTGGQTQVDGVAKDTQQINQRFGATLTIPINKRSSLKLDYLNSLSAVIGADFNRVGIAWQVRWGGGA